MARLQSQQQEAKDLLSEEAVKDAKVALLQARDWFEELEATFASEITGLQNCHQVGTPIYDMLTLLMTANMPARYLLKTHQTGSEVPRRSAPLE